MANGLYETFKEGLLDGTLDLTGNIKAYLVDTTYTENLATDEFVDPAISTDTVGSASANFASKTYNTPASGVFDAADITFSSVTGAQVGAIVIYIDSGVATTSNLVAFIDTATGLPVTPNGGDITVAWDSGANRIFKL